MTLAQRVTLKAQHHSCHLQPCGKRTFKTDDSLDIPSPFKSFVTRGVHNDPTQSDELAPRDRARVLA